MTARESDREDLMREATALVERAELKIVGYDEPIVVGFRRDGSASFFFGPDPVYQFNSTAQLRRAYIGGLLYKAERGRLVSLQRERTENEVALVRSEMTTDENAALLLAVSDRLTQLREALARDEYMLLGQVPTDADVCRRILKWLAAAPAEIEIASVPNAR